MAQNSLKNGKLTLDFVLKALQKSGLVSAQQASQLTARVDPEEIAAEHPLVTVAEQGWQSHTRPSFPLTLERLTRWLSEVTSQEYFRIDPLKIDVTRITGVVSQAYAAKLKILPLKILADPAQSPVWFSMKVKYPDFVVI